MNDWKDALSALTGVSIESEENENKKNKQPTNIAPKKRKGVVYSTNNNFCYSEDKIEEIPTLPKQQQKLRISMERAGRGGKTATLVRGFVGTETDLQALCKTLKQKCGVGGSAKNGEIIIQGDLREKLQEILKKEGYTQTK